VEAAIHLRQAQLPSVHDPLDGLRSVAAVVDVHAALIGEPAFEAFAHAPGLPEAEENLPGSKGIPALDRAYHRLTSSGGCPFTEAAR